jgi:camelysin-like metallo-endopeptidase
MKLKKFIAAHKVMATVVAVAAVSASALGGTYATFTATPVTIASNAFATGTLTIARGGSGAIFTSTNQKIGQESTGSVTISNTGSLDGAFSLGGTATGTLGPNLKLVIYKGTDNSGANKLYDGTLSAFSSADLGTIAGGASGTYYFHVSLPTTGSDATDNALQGKSASETFTWSAVQA